MSTVQAVVLCCGRGIACGSSVAWPVALHGQRGAQQLHTIARGLVTAARKFSALGASTSQVPNSIRPLLSQLSGARNVAAAASALPVARTSRAVMEMAVRKGRKVNVILLEQIDSLGHAGAEVSVAPGFARNFLVPFRKAVYATTANRAVHKIVLPPEEQRRVAQEREVNMLRARVAAFRLRLTRATNDGACSVREQALVHVAHDGTRLHANEAPAHAASHRWCHENWMRAAAHCHVH